ncbi:UDP-2,3-diacylglucosamine diphosphatase [Ferrimonas lipolytica]|uniref:UDP-2,3-diacylglucosamine hydrolase n=1 Tax=Ferrimonas lipolytica TaxID=2724191 RepID=A0A6H1UDL6_9GAMM|nr:UDP-2,3-diacylglucosamine diphosphatase [Ferrimonas lipolytica]QIZ77171.1 UDP-2,3-diacylglucosamine diphosphatase [Ferrimonas lipolytica]
MKVNAQSTGGSPAPRTLFIGDLHLSAERPDILAAFERFLLTQLDYADALYIVGDLFEIWIGDDDRNDFTDSVAAMLNQASKQLPIYFTHGNRDFVLGKRFAKRAGMTLLPQVHKVDLYGVSTVVLHGDMLCTADIEYQKYRRLWPLYKLLPIFVPLSKRKQMTANVRTRSQARTQQLSNEIMDVTPAAVDKMLKDNNAQQMIHGHTHKPAIHALANNKQRLVVGDWYQQDSVLIVTPAGCELLSKPL